ncbi:MAG TPA: PASTA domain-containing protein [Candidatus Binatia bacterium]|nr:PASTA domain-containing protein [Candidatus Binatia bacterium]
MTMASISQLPQFARPILAAMLVWAALAGEAAAQARVVPQYVGLPKAEVERRLIRAGFSAQWRSAGEAPYPEDRGRIAAQVPPAGNPLPSGAPVLLFVYDDGARPALPPAAAATPAPPAAAPAPATADCSRWAGSSYDRVIGACRCPEGQWWGLHGDRCESREKAGGDVCASKWSGSVPVFRGDGTFHCICPPDRPWNAETMECSGSSKEAAAECQSRWPGTVPVLSPSGTDYECRCPMGMRWEQSRARCDASVALEGHGAPPQRPDAGGVAPDPIPPPDEEGWDEGEPGHLDDPGSQRYEERDGPEGQFSDDDQVPWPPRRDGDRSPGGARDDLGDVDADRGNAGAGREDLAPPAPDDGDTAQPPGRVVTPGSNAQRGPGSDGNAEEEGPCAALLAEIRGRAGAGQAAEADALALHAAGKGCDPEAIAAAVAAGQQR